DVGAPARRAVVGPAVKRAANAVALDLASYGEVGAQVGAVRVDEAGLANLRPVQDQVAPEVVERADVATGQLVRGRHHEPAVGNGEGKALGHRARPDAGCAR